MFPTLLLAVIPFVQDPEAVDHALQVRLHPDAHRIEVVDEVRVPPAWRAERELRFRLHAGLGEPSVGEGWVVEAVGEEGNAEAGVGEHGRAPVRTFVLRAASGDSPVGDRVRLEYAGVIHHPLVAEEQEYARSFSRSAGLIGERGVVLSGSSFFVPDFGGAFVTFRLEVALPDGWQAVSQGERVAHGDGSVTWSCPHPMDEVYLVAGPWTEYEQSAGDGVTAMAFLREPDEALAARYLGVTAQYIQMYGRLIGPYPYAKFALVENFWETGYGMPSFTLLGPQVIRLPFILHTSYPHEILHNWWGNSVFVDVARGNWCEGLTAYLADHLIAEGQGRGVDYRRDTLKRYRDYVREGRDFALTEFRSRHSSATEAVGYGKALMVFHMLRRALGDEAFTRGLQTFYREQRFRRASWADLDAVFSDVAGRSLEPFFVQWLVRTGAPELRLGAVEADGENVRITLKQVQSGEPYALEVPVAVTLEGRDEAHVATVALDEREESFEIDVPGRATLVQVDPAFDVFRRLDRSEIPPSIGQLFGAPRVTLVLPGSDDPLSGAWGDLAASWTGSEQAEVEVVGADALDALPPDRAVWILGSTNPWARAVRDAVVGYGALVEGDTIDFGGPTVARRDHCFVLTAPHPADTEVAIGWIGADRAAALPGLARKLPHYGKYSYLAFEGEEPTNDAKGQWTVTDSPLTRRLSDRAVPAALPPRAPLTR